MKLTFEHEIKAASPKEMAFYEKIKTKNPEDNVSYYMVAGQSKWFDPVLNRWAAMPWFVECEPITFKVLDARTPNCTPPGWKQEIHAYIVEYRLAIMLGKFKKVDDTYTPRLEW